MAGGHSLQTGFVRSDTGEPQQANLDADGNVRVSVVGGSGSAVSIADGSDVAEGSTSDAAWVSGNGTVISLLKKIASAGGSAVSIADGADVAEGTKADAAIVSDTSGTVIGFLRGLVKIFASVWDSTAGRLKVATIGSKRTATGTVTLNGDTVTIDTTGMSTVAVVATAYAGGFDGLVSTQVSNDGGTTWSPVTTVQSYNGFGGAFSRIPNDGSGQFIFPVAGNDTFRLSLSGRTVGFAIFALQASPISWTFPQNQTTIVGTLGNGVVVGGSGALSVAGPVSATIVGAATKAASTAATGSDTALVVAVSPNNTPVLPSLAATSTLQESILDRLSGVSGTVTVEDLALDGTVFTAGFNAPSALAVQGTTGMVPVAVSGTVTTGGLTDTQLRATPVPVIDATLTAGTAKTQITDGVTAAAVKAASTAATASDPALVMRSVQLPAALSTNLGVKVGGSATGSLANEVLGVVLNASGFAPAGSVGLATSSVLLALGSALTVDTTHAIGVVVYKAAAGVSGTGIFEGSIDGGTTWVPLTAVARTTGSGSASSEVLTHITTWAENVSGFGPAVLYISTAGFNRFRVRITSALDASQTFFVGTVVAKITDGVTAVAVKAASVLPALTDGALVTTQRDPLPSGTNVIGAATAAADVYGNDGPGPNYAALATGKNLTETYDGRLRVILDEQARNGIEQLHVLNQILAVLRASHLQLGNMMGSVVDPADFIGNDTVN